MTADQQEPVLSERITRLIAEPGPHKGCDSFGEEFIYVADLLKALRSSPSSGEPVALAHIRETDTYLDIKLQVLDGTHLQPEHSPVKLYTAPSSPAIRELEAAAEPFAACLPVIDDPEEAWEDEQLQMVETRDGQTAKLTIGHFRALASALRKVKEAGE